MISDPIGDTITRIRNGYQARQKKVPVVYSRINAEVLRILAKAGYIGQPEVIAANRKTRQPASIMVGLIYTKGKPALEKVRRISKPGRRVYTTAGRLKPVMSGMGLAVISTSSGLMTDRDARQKGLGGEILIEAW